MSANVPTNLWQTRQNFPRIDRGSQPDSVVKADPAGVALCLSGGGYRAAIFHLGALRRLCEIGALPLVDTIASVSGGSILAAHLAATHGVWSPGCDVDQWDVKVAKPFRAFIKKDIITRPTIAAMLPWNWRTRFAADPLALATEYQKLCDQPLCKLPDRPRFYFCATELEFGRVWCFAKNQVGSWLGGWRLPTERETVALATAASSAFPPVVAPLTVKHWSEPCVENKIREPDPILSDQPPLGPAKPNPSVVYPFDVGLNSEEVAESIEAIERQNLLSGVPDKTADQKTIQSHERINTRTVQLTDGGVADNLGLEAVWKNHRVLLISNAGFPFRFDWRWTAWRLNWMGRCFSTICNHLDRSRIQWLFYLYKQCLREGAYWGIGVPLRYYNGINGPGYSRTFVEDVIAPIRTDMDSFSEEEINVIENYGYLLAVEITNRHLIPSPWGSPSVLYWQLKNVDAKPPHPDNNAFDEPRLTKLLRHSDRRVRWRRFFKF